MAAASRPVSRLVTHGRELRPNRRRSANPRARRSRPPGSGPGVRQARCRATSPAGDAHGLGVTRCRAGQQSVARCGPFGGLPLPPADDEGANTMVAATLARAQTSRRVLPAAPSIRPVHPIGAPRAPRSQSCLSRPRTARGDSRQDIARVSTPPVAVIPSLGFVGALVAASGGGSDRYGLRQYTAPPSPDPDAHASPGPVLLFTDWRAITSGIPAGQAVRTITEDLKNLNVLFVGTEAGLFVSLNKDQHFGAPAIGGSGGRNPDPGAAVTYYPRSAARSVSARITDASGALVRGLPASDFAGELASGAHRVP